MNRNIFLRLTFLAKIPDKVLKFLSRAEDSNTVGVNCNKLSGLRIAGLLSALACPDLKCSESAELDDHLFLKSSFDFLEELINNLMDIVSVDSKLLMKMLNNNGFGKFCLFHVQYPISIYC